MFGIGGGLCKGLGCTAVGIGASRGYVLRELSFFTHLVLLALVPQAIPKAWSLTHGGVIQLLKVQGIKTLVPVAIECKWTGPTLMNMKMCDVRRYETYQGDANYCSSPCCCKT